MPDGCMTGDSAELAQLAEQVRTWRQPIEVALQGFGDELENKGIAA
jgi:hypothetical protein